MKIITKDELYEMLLEEERQGKNYLTYTLGTKEIDGLLYEVWRDNRNGDEYAVRTVRTVHMGFNSNEDGKLEEFIEVVEREGSCKASWGVTGRTAHLMLANQLKQMLPQYQFVTDYESYLCQAYRMIPMAGTSDPEWGKKHWGQ